MPKGTRRPSTVHKSGTRYSTTNSKGEVNWAKDKEDIRTLVGDKGVDAINKAPLHTTVGANGKVLYTNRAGAEEYARRAKVARVGKNVSEKVDKMSKDSIGHALRKKAKADKTKASLDKAGKDAIELVRRKKSTYRDDYKD